MRERPEVLIDGVRYVPLATIQPPSLEQIRDVLLDLYWGEGYRGQHPETASEGVFVTVSDDNPDGDLPTVDEFMERLALKLAGN